MAGGAGTLVGGGTLGGGLYMYLAGLEMRCRADTLALAANEQTKNC